MITSRHCPVCNTSPERASVFVEETIDKAKLTQFSFASRKEPEFMSHRLVRCPTCDLVYADRPPDEDELAHAYHVAAYDSSAEANDAAEAYVLAIKPTLTRMKRRERALEIGTGTGVFLEHLARSGFTTLVGVEPSRAAIDAAPEHRRGWIREAMFSEGDFGPESFDLVCCFMTMEHVRDPGALARSALRLLRPGGAFVTVTHDYTSAVNKALGKRSPIIDVEHMQLFSPASARYLFQSSGYQDVAVKAFVNKYNARYWLRLMPLPTIVKRTADMVVGKVGLANVKLGFNVGNILTSGLKTA